MGLTSRRSDQWTSGNFPWLAENPAPALILLDLMMPEMDGFEFLDAFNSHAEWHHVPVWSLPPSS